MTKMQQETRCKGSWILGTACGKCDRCAGTMPEAVETIRQLRNEVSDLSSATHLYRDKMKEAAKILTKLNR